MNFLSTNNPFPFRCPCHSQRAAPETFIIVYCIAFHIDKITTAKNSRKMKSQLKRNKKFVYAMDITG